MVNQNGWPNLIYSEFKETSHLLHMACQMLGKLTLLKPFEPEWANVILHITSRGLSTGPIPYENGTFTLDMDLIAHQVNCMTSWSTFTKFPINSMSVAQFFSTLLDALRSIEVEVTINTKPQEVPNPIPFEEDIETQAYDSILANNWWQILVKSKRVFDLYHARFTGKTQPIGLMWGTFDLRDVRYSGEKVTPTGINTGYLRRNAMDAALIESGWWSGNENYPKAAYYSFTYPEPKEIDKVIIKPSRARWEKTQGIFILDYDDILTSETPEQDLLDFLDSTYQVGAQLANWDSSLIGSGKPI
jgi:hypothetical protein